MAESASLEHHDGYDPISEDEVENEGNKTIQGS